MTEDHIWHDALLLELATQVDSHARIKIKVSPQEYVVARSIITCSLHIWLIMIHIFEHVCSYRTLLFCPQMYIYIFVHICMHRVSLFYFGDERSPALLFRRILDLERTIVSSHGSKVMYEVKSFRLGTRLGLPSCSAICACCSSLVPLSGHVSVHLSRLLPERLLRKQQLCWSR